jgi:hypothetical protein
MYVGVSRQCRPTSTGLVSTSAREASVMSAVVSPFRRAKFPDEVLKRCWHPASGVPRGNKRPTSADSGHDRALDHRHVGAVRRWNLTEVGGKETLGGLERWFSPRGQDLAFLLSSIGLVRPRSVLIQNKKQKTNLTEVLPLFFH